MNRWIQVGARREIQSKALREMHRLRAKIFHQRMGWEVPLLRGMEIDGYDALDPHYIVIGEGDNSVRGCLRLLPTEGPYMLKDTFPELLHGQMPPIAKDIWEISRFAIETDGQKSFGFADMALDVMREIVLFGDRRGIHRYVVATTTAIERLLRNAGIAITRYGPPIRIGVENAVALDIDIGEQTHRALFGDLAKAA